MVSKGPQLPHVEEILSETHEWQLFFLHKQGQLVMEVPLWRSCRSDAGLRTNQITTFGWGDELTTAFEQVSELITTFGWIGLPMTASGQKE